MQKFPFRITGIASRIGRIVPIDEWAEKVPIPHRQKPGETLTGADIKKILGIESKSWDPELFGDFDEVRRTAMHALESAGTRPDEIDAVFIVTCTPYEIMLDQDSFHLLRRLGLRDDVAPIQLGAGCAGVVRAASIASRMQASRALVITYNVPSLFLMVAEGEPNPAYLDNPAHPYAETLWASPAIFSDGAAAVVLERSDDDGEYFFYSRDAHSFGSGPASASALVTFEGGGAQHPPGSQGCDELSCFAMAGSEIKEYYVKGMMLNHEALLGARPGYFDEVKRIYVHQSSPMLVAAFVALAGLDPTCIAMKVAEYGNLVSASTLRLIHEDLLDGQLLSGDEICLSVVGAGPERGIFTCRVDVRNIVPA